MRRLLPAKCWHRPIGRICPCRHALHAPAHRTLIHEPSTPIHSSRSRNGITKLPQSSFLRRWLGTGLRPTLCHPQIAATVLRTQYPSREWHSGANAHSRELAAGNLVSLCYQPYPEQYRWLTDENRRLHQLRIAPAPGIRLWRELHHRGRWLLSRYSPRMSARIHAAPAIAKVSAVSLQFV